MCIACKIDMSTSQHAAAGRLIGLVILDPEPRLIWYAYEYSPLGMDVSRVWNRG